MKRNKLLFLILLIMLPVLAGCSNKDKPFYNYSGIVSVYIGMGQEGYITNASYLPVKTDISGEYSKKGNFIVLTVPAGENECYSYSRELTDAYEQSAEFVVPAAPGSTQLTVELLDEQHNTIYSRTCSYSISSKQNICLGYVGYSSDAVAWPNEINYNDTTVSVKSISLMQNNIYKDFSAYEMFDFLVIDKLFYSELKADEKSAFMEYAEDGGKIIFEGEGNLDKAVSESITSDSCSNDYTVGNNAELVTYSYGEGYIIDSSRTMNEMLPTLTDYQKVEFVKDMVSNIKPVRKAVIDTFAAETLPRTASEGKNPGIWFYAVLLFIYVAVVLPLIFALMKKMRIINWYGAAASMAAVFFAAVIYVSGTGTRFSTPFIENLTVLYYKDSGVREDNYINIQSPFNASYSITIPSDFLVIPFGLEEGDERSSNYGNMSRRTISIEYLGESTQIGFGSLTAFSSKNLCLTRMLSESTEALEGYLSDIKDIAVVWKDNVYLCDQLDGAVNTEDIVSKNKGQSLTREQFYSEGYKNRGGWNTVLGEYYKDMIKCCDNSEDKAYLIGRIDYEPSYQLETDYNTDSYSLLIKEMDMKEIGTGD